MNKFKKWTIDTRHHYPMICGYIYDHPKFDNGNHIYTSRIADVRLEKDSLIARTSSGTIYELPFAEHPGKTNDISALSEFFNEHDIAMIISSISSATKKAFEELKEHQIAIAPEDECVIINLSSTDYHFESILYHDHDHDFFTKHHYLHLSHYKDSVLIGYPEVDDFRYYASSSDIQFYKFTEKHGHVYIYNSADDDMLVKSPNGEFTIHPDSLDRI